ncbi:AAA family ATPase [Anaerolineae bacterium CFX9]|jgi:MoxR-like ATPase|nr:AAA family ATPase [Anaerolineae bacterium CFX9]
MSSAPAESMNVETFSRLAQTIEAEVKRVIVGQDDVVRAVLICIIAGRHALLEGVPGLGKTILIRTMADALNLRFSRIQFTPDMQPADITGTDILEDSADGRSKIRRFQPGPVFANLILADEINRATPKTQSALLEAMAEKTVTVANTTYPLEAPFFVLATQNPLEMEGTYPLPEAQLDRFMFKVNVSFPSREELVSILDRTTGSGVPSAQKVADGAQVIEMGRKALDVPVPTHVTEYVARLVLATHAGTPDAPEIVRRYVRYGASPRGAQSLILGAKINALLEGRFNVAFDDVAAVAPAALRHRIILNYDAGADGVPADAIIAETIKSLPKA